jgi:hypothetical protein
MGHQRKVIIDQHQRGLAALPIALGLRRRETYTSERRFVYDIET